MTRCFLSQEGVCPSVAPQAAANPPGFVPCAPPALPVHPGVRFLCRAPLNDAYTLAHKKPCSARQKSLSRPPESRKTASLAPMPLAAGKSPVPPTLPPPRCPGQAAGTPVTYIGASLIARVRRHPGTLPRGTRLGCRPARRTPQPSCAPQQWRGGVGGCHFVPSPSRIGAPAGASPAGWRGRTSSPAPRTRGTACSGMRPPVHVPRGAAGPRHPPRHSLASCPARSSGPGAASPSAHGSTPGLVPTDAGRRSQARCPPRHAPRGKKKKKPPTRRSDQAQTW